MTKLAAVLLLTLACCAPQANVSTGATVLPDLKGIVYSSTDPSDIMLFSREGTRFSPIVNLMPTVQTKYLEPSSGVQCVSIGIPGNSSEYAIKRPIKEGDRFQCLTTTFRVVRCLENCREAIVEIASGTRRVGNDPYISTMLVSGCLGVLAFSDTEELNDGLPFDALVLRGDVGVLADPTYPNCIKLSRRAFR